MGEVRRRSSRALSRSHRRTSSRLRRLRRTHSRQRISQVAPLLRLRRRG